MVNEVLVNHIVWADNTYLIAASQMMLAEMVKEVTVELWKRRLSWKANSIQWMRAGPIPAPDMKIKRSIRAGIASFSKSLSSAMICFFYLLLYLFGASVKTHFSNRFGNGHTR